MDWNISSRSRSDVVELKAAPVRYSLAPTLALGLASAILDFASALTIRMGNSGMVSWTGLLLVLGVVTAATGILSSVLTGTRWIRLLAALMVVYGITMVAIGYIMRSNIMIEGGAISSVGMLIVGLAMIASGLLMTLTPTKKSGMMKPQ